MTKHEQACEFLKLLIDGTQSGVLKWYPTTGNGGRLKHRLELDRFENVWIWSTPEKIYLEYGYPMEFYLETNAGAVCFLEHSIPLLSMLWNLVDRLYGADYTTAHYIDLVRAKLEANAKEEKSNHGM